MEYEEVLKDKRLATQSEKQLLFDALAKAGKIWNSDTLEVEDLKVEPKVGDCVKLSDEDGASYLLVGFISGCRICEKGDYLFNKEIIGKTNEFFEDYLKVEIVTLSQFQSEVNALGFEYDFESDKFKELKWVPKLNEHYYYFDGCLDSPILTNNTNCSRDKGNILLCNCFKTKAECESAIEKIKKLLK